MAERMALLVDGRPHGRRTFFTTERGLDAIEGAPERAPLRLAEALRLIESRHPELSRIAVMAEADPLARLALLHRGRCEIVPLPWTPGGIHEDPERTARFPLAWGDSYALLVLLLDGNAGSWDLVVERLALGLTAPRKIILEELLPLSRPPRPGDGWSLLLDRAEAIERPPRLRAVPLTAGRLLRRKLEGLAAPVSLRLLSWASAVTLALAVLLAALGKALEGLFRPPLPPRPDGRAAFEEALAVLGPRPASLVPAILESFQLRDADLPIPIRASPSPFPELAGLAFGRGPIFLDARLLASPLKADADDAGLLPSPMPRHRTRLLPFGFWSLVPEARDWKELLERESGDETLVLSVPGPAIVPPDDLPDDLPGDETTWRALLAERGWALHRIVEVHRSDGPAAFRLLPLVDRFGGDRLLGSLPPGSIVRRALEACLDRIVPDALDGEIRAAARGSGRRRLVLALSANGPALRSAGSGSESTHRDAADGDA